MKIENILKENNNRVTPERIAIFEFLKTKHIFTYNDIIENFKSLGRASIFRTLNLFLDLAIIRKIDVGDKTMTYEFVDHHNHHEHMRCDCCNSIIGFHADSICKMILEEAKKMWFQVKSHSISVVGKCKNCLEIKK